MALGKIKYFLPCLTCALFLSCCASSFTRTQLLMGNIPIEIIVQAPPSQKKRALLAMDHAFKKARDLESKITTFDPNSEISCLNQFAGEKKCKISPEVYELLKTSLEFNAKFQGAFDIRFKSKTFSGRRGVIELQPDRAKLREKETQISLGGIGKGFILDQMLNHSDLKYFEKVFINGAGDMVCSGGFWKVGIQIPQAPRGRFSHILTLTNKAVATSGNDERPGHLVDPSTLKSVSRPQNVTVIANTLTQADALATTFYILGEEKTASVIKKLSHIKVFWTDPDGTTRSYENLL